MDWRNLYSMEATIVCPYCLKPMSPKEMTRDHVIPKSRGGKTEESNIIIVCKRCNQEKGALTLEEYKEWKRLNTIRNGGRER